MNYMKKEFIECGKILGAHGVRGVCRVEVWCDSPRVLCMQKHIFLAEKDGTFKELIEALMQKPIEEIKELYNNREIEK